MRHWHEVEDWLRDCAHDDVVASGAVRPTLVAFGGAQPLLVARWRPFGPQEGGTALGELLTVTTPLGADRLAVAVGGTVSALDGPPHHPGDALVIASATCGEEPATRCTLTPYERDGQRVQWGLPWVSEAVAGWLPRMLAEAVQRAMTPTRPSADLAARVLRCLVLGHEVHVPTTRG